MAEETDVEHVEMDHGTFNRAERRELQVRFGNDFETLRKFILLSMGRRGIIDPSLKLVDEKGKQVFADDVFIAMVTIVRRRTNPDATDSDLHHLGTDGLKAMIAPKAPPTEEPSSTEPKT